MRAEARQIEASERVRLLLQGSIVPFLVQKVDHRFQASKVALPGNRSTVHMILRLARSVQTCKQTLLTNMPNNFKIGVEDSHKQKT